MAGNPLETALERALAEGDYAGALRLARNAWIETAEPALVELMDRLARHVPADPVVARGRESHQAAWLRRCAEDDPADLTVLLDDLFGRHHPGNDAKAVRAMVARTPDPRAALAFALFLSQRRSAMGGMRAGMFPLSSSKRGFWMAGIDLIARIGEPTSLAELRRWASHHEGARKPWGRAVAAHLLRTAAEVRERPVHPLPGVAALAAGVGEPREERDLDALWAEAYANPRDLSVRHVLADALQEAGDPRGELIALQLAREPGASPSSRERQLLKQWERTWLGPLEPLSQRAGIVWVNGFLDTVRLGEYIRVEGSVVTDVIWRTVRRIELHPYVQIAAVQVLLGSPLVCLEEVAGFSLGEVERLGTRDWTRFGVSGWWDPQDAGAPQLALLETWPRLRHLDVSEMNHVEEPEVRQILAVPAVRRLERVRIPQSLADRAARLAPVGGPAIEVLLEAWDLRLFAVDGGRPRLEVRSLGNRRKDPQRALERFIHRAGPLSEVRLVDVGPVKLDIGRVERAALAVGAQFSMGSRDGG